MLSLEASERITTPVETVSSFVIAMLLQSSSDQPAASIPITGPAAEAVMQLIIPKEAAAQTITAIFPDRFRFIQFFLPYPSPGGDWLLTEFEKYYNFITLCIHDITDCADCQVFSLLLCLPASYIRIAEAIPAFRDSTFPHMGMRISRSASAAAASDRPRLSFPIRNAQAQLQLT